MKFKTTKKAINEGYNNIICVPYCGLQHLLARREPAAYTARREGWAADIYDIGAGACIVTGYGPFGNIRPDYEIIRRYDTVAADILYNYAFDPEEQAAELDQLLNEFIAACTR